MTQPPTPNDPDQRAAANWARPTDRLSVNAVPAGATNVNVEGREVVSPMQGFGPLWRKTYRVRLEGVSASPEEVVRGWKEHFPKFQPAANKFYPPLLGVKPGEVMFISATLPVWPGSPGIVPISAGVLVMYADETMFTVMTPAGFPESGWNSFSAYTEDGVTVAQVQSLARTSDPIFEFGFRFMGGSKQQESIWRHVLTELARHFGVSHPNVEVKKDNVDPSLQWGNLGQIGKNSIIVTMLYYLATPFRWLRRKR
jgi:hypothetical protein